MNSDDRATDEQLTYLRRFGYRQDHVLTRCEAASLLRGYQRSSSSPVIVGITAREEAARLRAAVEETRQGAARAAVPELRSAQERLDAALASRQDFWIDTCREVGQMHISSAEVFELYRCFGCRFCTPSPQEVQEVLDALDAALPRWDFEHPELFYQTLELNFTEVVRHA
jgi:hypothetical protein